MMRELITVKQENDESLAEFMARIQNLADRAFHGQTDESKQQVSVNAFCNGLVDQDAARLVAVQAKGSVAGALNIAASVGAYSKHPMKARKYKPDKNPYNYNFLANESTTSTLETNYEDSHDSVPDDYDENDLEYEHEDEYMCAAPSYRGRRPSRGFSRTWGVDEVHLQGVVLVLAY